MKKIKITGSKIAESLAQIDTFVELNPKERGCLRLLTEEMFSMCRELLGTYSLDFEIKQDGSRFDLSGTTQARITETAREHLLSLSSSGKNAATQGIKGILGSVLEFFSSEGKSDAYSSDLAYGMHEPGQGYARVWTLSRYMEVLEERSLENQWDGMERSIIANFSDDVSIGVRDGRLEITITKTF